MTVYFVRRLLAGMIGWTLAGVLLAAVFQWAPLFGLGSGPVSQGGGLQTVFLEDGGMKGVAAVSLTFERLGASLKVAGLAFALVVALGAPLGVLLGRVHWPLLRSALALPVFGAAWAPGFWLAGLLAAWLLDRYGLGVFGAATGQASFASERDRALDAWWHVFLPAVALAPAGVGWLALRVREALLLNIAASHIEAGRARGLSEETLFVHHVLRNSLRPIVETPWSVGAYVFGGLILVEPVLGYPGAGSLILQAALEANFGVLLAANLAVGLVLVVSRAVSEALVFATDPRQRF